MPESLGRFYVSLPLTFPHASCWLISLRAVVREVARGSSNAVVAMERSSS